MKIERFRAKNFRSFVDSGDISLKKMNVIIGANNSGKSSILRAIHLLQKGLSDIYGDVRTGESEARVEIGLNDVSGKLDWAKTDGPSHAIFTAALSSADRRTGNINCQVIRGNANVMTLADARFPNYEPDHIIVPFLSRRKTNGYSEDIREEQVKVITNDLSTLTAKLSRIGNPAFPAHKPYANACERILGFILTAIPSQNGQRPGVYLPDLSTIPIEQMGEGVPNIAYLLVCLATSQNKIFLMEEPENDLHPSALKALLELITQSAQENNNQFIISTHSNIVVQHLCGLEDSCLLKVSIKGAEMPHVTQVETVPEDPSARMAALQELGYSFADFDLWDGWLILEESSAERIIRDFLIPWFAPALRSIRTISAGGVDNVEPTLADFMRMMVFTHLEPIYKDRAWVRIDNDKAGIGVATKLRENYKSWSEGRIKTLTVEQFEDFYPTEFKDRVQQIQEITNTQEKREKKKQLLKDVVDWLNLNEIQGKKALQESASELINDLKEIESQLISLRKKDISH